MKKAIGIAAAIMLAAAWVRADDQGRAGSDRSGTDRGGERAGSVTLSGSQEQLNRQYFNEMHQMNLWEIETSRLAEQKAQNPRVKELAARMLKDHTDADQKLMRL